MDSIHDSFLALNPYSRPSILMGDDSDIPTKGIDMINIDNGHFNNVLYAPDIATNILSIYQMTPTSLSKRLTFNQYDVEIS